MRIGILGGTFDPVHNGHLYIAGAARRAFRLAQVRLMPAGTSPFKLGRQTASFADRLEMVRQAVQDCPGLYPCGFEGAKGAVSYTAETLSAMARLYPEDEFWFILGDDAYQEFDRWREPEKILALARLIVVTRPGYQEKPCFSEALAALAAGRVEHLELPGMDISSTCIRRRMEAGEDCSGTLPPSVLRYINSRGLYSARLMDKNG